MNKPQGYDEAQAAQRGAAEQLPAGNYVCIIKRATIATSSTGKEMLVLLLDIAEGDYKDFWTNKFNTSKYFNPDAKWSCIYRQLTEGTHTQYFKGLIRAIEESNSGYKWNWDETTLKDKKIGVLFGREEFLDYEGKKRMSCKPRFICSIKSLKSKSVLEDKKLQNSGQASGFLDLGEDVSEDDLPF